MNARQRWFRSSRLLVLPLLLLLIAGAFPAGAQSPVAEQPPIKLVRVVERLCPDDFDPSTGTVEQNRAACPSVVNGMVFTLISQDPSYPASPATVNMSGQAEWPYVPSGSPFTITRAGSFDYGTAWVSCRFYGNFDPAVPDTERVFRPVPPSHTIEIGFGELGLTNYQAIECAWFDVPVVAELPESGNTVTPTTTPVRPESVADTSNDGVLDEGGSGPNFTVTPTPAGPLEVADTTNAGVLVQAESIPTSTPTPALPQDDAGTTNAGVEVETDAGAAGSPESSAITPPDTSDAATVNAGLLGDPNAGAHVDIQLYVCPYHSDAHLQAIPACGSTLQGTGFTINGDAGSTQYTTPGGFALFQGVPYGEVTITALGRENWDTARVFCHTQSSTAAHGPIDPAHEIPFTAGTDDTFSVTLTVQPGEMIDCRWFDTTVTESFASSVLLHEFVCPPGVDTSQGGLAELRAGCATPQGNGYFVVDSYPKMGGRTSGNGDRTFLNVTSTTFPLTATQPLGYLTKRVFCVQYHASDWDHITESYVEFPVTAPNSVTVSLQPQWEIDCYWFVQEGTDYGFLDITAQSCPVNFNPAATTPRNTFAQQCSVGLDGVPFDVVADFGYDFATNPTSVAGTAYFQQPVPPAPLTITGHTPNTHRYLRAFCGSAPYVGIGAIPTTWTSFSSIQTIWEVKAGDQVVCEFYYQPLTTAASGSPEDAAPQTVVEAGASPEAGTPETQVESSASSQLSPTPDVASITEVDTPSPTAAPTSESVAGESPAGPDASATLLLNLRTCPVGYDVYAENADPVSDCAGASGAPAVTLDGAPGETSADGVAGWTGLPAGAAQIESGPGAFLGACSSDRRAIPADAVVPYVFAGPNGTVGISLLAGETLTCDWYMMADEVSGSVTVTLLSCPGPTVIEAQCEPAPGPASVQFEPVGGADAAFTLEIDDSGTGAASVSGTYQLVGFPEGACSIESDAFDATGALVIAPGASVEVRIYLCGS